MMGPQDVGGRSGFGPIETDPNAPLFHAEWERRALALTLCCGALGHWSLDESRFARESLPAGTYYTSGYYAIWLRALETLLIRHGELTPPELEAGRAIEPPRRPERKLAADAVAGVLQRGGPVSRPSVGDPAFAVGQAVRTTKTLTPGHTRLPGYARDKGGVVVAVRGFHVLPDASAVGEDEAAWLYTVRFEGPELWGASAEPGTAVQIDAWEPYLERA